MVLDAGQPSAGLAGCQSHKIEVNMPTKKSAKLPPKLTKTEEDLLHHLTHGYQFESDPFGGGLLLRNLKDKSMMRTASANLSTVKALESRGLIKATQGRNDLTTTWRARRRGAE